MPKKNIESEKNGIHFSVIGIGASAGGLEAFKSFVKVIPQNPGMAFVFVQHLHPDFESSLPAIIQRETKLPVIQINDDLRPIPDNIYILPSNKILEVSGGMFKLSPRKPPPELSHPIDVFLTSLAEEYQSNAIGIILSGLGSDGTIGLKKIKDFGGITFAQEIGSAGFDSMPNHAISSGMVDFVMTPEQMPAQLINLDQTLRNIPVEPSESEKFHEEDNFRQILALLRVRRGVDFTYYKQSTIRRRILRRMVINKIDNLESYLEQLRGNKQEQDVLYQDLLIPVTSFFRDAETFDHLCENVFPELAKNKSVSDPLRIWVAGCSTGEEAYSIGMCLHENLGEKLSSLKVQIFATDISERSIVKARTGIYNKRELESISERRLQEHFHKVDGGYQVKKIIRDMCVFACHNFLKDPPFARIDLISCRNVLIYMEGYLQKKALNTFHYALNEKGYLLLGKSETTSNAGELFTSAGKQDKLYIRKQVPARFMNFNTERSEKLSKENDVTNPTEKRKNDFQRNADDLLLARFSPAGVIVNDQFDIVQFRGATGDFLEAVPGKASLNIFKMVRDGMAFEIRNALHKAKLTSEAVIKENILVKDGTSTIDIEVIPLLNTIEAHYIILFKHNEKNKLAGEAALSKTKGNSKVKKTADQLRLIQLEKDLAQLREDMRSITEDQEAANEELQSANEELLSGSEELQSLNEELETSKEELQSTNEELLTINHELFERSEQYNQARLYTETIVKTIHEPIVVLNKDLRIKSANQSFFKTFQLNEDEISNRIIFELQDGKWDIPEFRSPLLSIQSGKQRFKEWEITFPFFHSGERIFYIIAQLVEGPANEPMILITIDDITLQKKEIELLRTAANEIKKELVTLEKFFEHAPAGFCILNGSNHIFQFANPSYGSMFGLQDLKGKCFSDAFTGKEKTAILNLLNHVYKTGEGYFANEVPFVVTRNGKEKTIYLDISYQPLKNESGEVNGILVFTYDVTEKITRRMEWEQQAEELERQVVERTLSLNEMNTDLIRSNKSLEQFASIASHDLQEPLRKVQTFIMVLLQKHKESMPLQVQELIGKIDISAKRMSSLIKDVLNYSRLSKTEAIFVPTDLNIILKDVLSDFDLVIQEKNVKVNFSEMPAIDAVPSQMNQLFYNLIGNALKFSGEKDIVINITSSTPSIIDVKKHPILNPLVPYVEILFQDNGIGFDPEFAEQIFLIFQRLNDVTKYPGTGIGLALCQNIVFLHHGIIWATSNKNEGTKFHVLLPVKQFQSLI